MNDTLKEDLDLPVIGGVLTAYFTKDFDLMEKEFIKEFPEYADERWLWSNSEFKKFRDRTDRKYYKTDWYISFDIHSGDRRFNSGHATIHSEHEEVFADSCFEHFCIDLADALKKMKVLEEKKFSGSYKKTIGTCRNPELEVVAENNRVYLNFGAKSETHKFSHALSIATTEKIIEEIKEVPEKALNLMISLEELS